MNEAVQYWTVEHRSGTYIARTVELASPRLLVEICAVVRHPLQGDLHHPYQPDVALFHERRAASRREKVWVPRSAATPHEGAVPDYDASLRKAWQEQVDEMKRLIESKAAADPELARWAALSLEKLDGLRDEYWR